MQFIDLQRQYEAYRAEFEAAMAGVLAGAKFILGPEVGRLEEELAAYAGRRFAIACGNGTSSLEMALMAAGVGPGDAVFCPAFTFIATAEVAMLRGATPVFVDIDPVTYNIDPADLAAKIAAVGKAGRLAPKAVIPVDLFGLPADYGRLEPLAREYGLFLLEDAAQGFGGSLGGQRAGSFGQASSTSFFPAKPLGCYGDGGAMFTDDEALAATLRSLRGHGQGDRRYEHVRVGQNSRLDTLQAAVLLVKLAHFPQELAERQRVAARYSKNLAGAVTVPTVPGGCVSSFAQYTIRVAPDKRAGLMARLKEKGVPTAIYYPTPLHLQPVFAHLGGRPGDLPQAEKASAEAMSLPFHPFLADDEVDFICGELRRCLR